MECFHVYFLHSFAVLILHVCVFIFCLIVVQTSQNSLHCTKEDALECVAWRVHMFEKTYLCCLSSKEKRDDIATVECVGIFKHFFFCLFFFFMCKDELFCGLSVCIGPIICFYFYFFFRILFVFFLAIVCNSFVFLVWFLL